MCVEPAAPDPSPADSPSPSQDYYDQLLERVDGFMADLLARHPQSLTCREGCSSCCGQDLTVFPVEAARVRRALEGLGEEARHLLAERRAGPGGSSCPLLLRDLCSIYPDRPLICRTHGAPILVREAEGARVDVCPLNFQGASGSIPPASVLDLDRLNEILVAVNVHHCRRQGQDPGARSTLSRILESVLGLPGQGATQKEEVS